MRPVSVEYLFDGDKAVFYFESENRVDFREMGANGLVAPACARMTCARSAFAHRRVWWAALVIAARS